jgi:hypothetical protein
MAAHQLLEVCMLKRNAICALVGLAMAWVGSAAMGQVSATATLYSQQLSPNSYEYFITLNNTGTVPLETFWFSWIPGYDLLPSVPTSVSSPGTWGDSIQQEASINGSASIQWVNATTPLAGGQSLSGFNFITQDAPALINGSPVILPAEYSYVYTGIGELGTPGFLSVQTVAAPLPEPTSLALVAGPMAWMLRRKRTASRA